MELTKSQSSATPSGSNSLNKGHIFPFLKLSGELRNLIYEYVAATAPIVRVFENRTILPPLACVCRKIRSEMSGKYEEEVVLYPRIPIEAYSSNLHFRPLFKWLEENDRRLEGHTKFVRTLHVA